MAKKNENPNVLAPNDRRDWKSLIQRRQQTMLEALEGQMGGTVDKIISELKAQRGIALDEGELTELIESVDEQIKAEIERHLSDEKSRVEVEIEGANDDFDLKEREMKARHKREWDELGKERRAKIDELKGQLRSAEERIARQYTTELLKKKQEYQSQLITVKEQSKLIAAEAESRMRLITISKGKLINLITDAGGRALEKLMMVETREEAKELLESIPTVTEAIELARSSDGIMSLIKRLNHDHMLPAPEGMETPANNVAVQRVQVTPANPDVIDAELIPTTVEEVGESNNSDGDYYRNRQHEREVYGDR